MRFYFLICSIFYSGFLLAQLMDNDTPQTLHMTDEEQKISQDFVHEGLATKIMQDECKDIEEYCKGEEQDERFLGLPNELVLILSQAYSTIVGIGGFGLKMRSSAVAAAREQDPMASDSKPDYCSKIPITTDMLALFKQSMDQQNLRTLPPEGDTVQKQQLLKAAQSHKIRAETSTLQAVGYGSCLGCYLGMVAFAGIAVSDLLVRIPAAGLLTAFYTQNAIRQKAIYERVKKIADKMPGRGYCNPITERDCYCDAYKEIKKDQANLDQENQKRREEVRKDRELTTADYVFSFLGAGRKFKQYHEKVAILDEAAADKYCRPKLHQNSVAEDSIRVSCIDKDMQLDPFCKCKGENACFDQSFIKFDPSITPEMFASSGLEDFSSLTRGELRGGRVGSATFNRNAIRNKSRLKDFAQKYPVTGELDKNAMDLALLAEKTFGVPKELVGHLTRRPMTDAERERGKKFINPGNLENMKFGKNEEKDSVLVFDQPRVAARNPANLKPSDNDSRSQKGKNLESGEILEFVKRAEAKAQINEKKEATIFNLISKRYQISGYRYLQGGNPNEPGMDSIR